MQKKLTAIYDKIWCSIANITSLYYIYFSILYYVSLFFFFFFFFSSPKKNIILVMCLSTNGERA